MLTNLLIIGLSSALTYFVVEKVRAWWEKTHPTTCGYCGERLSNKFEDVYLHLVTCATAYSALQELKRKDAIKDGRN